jgi:PIN domain nuclease of toxin-antitoxin system
VPAAATVLDASALLALLNGEAGGSAVTALLAGAAMSAVNWSEVVQKALQHGVTGNPEDLRRDVEALGVELHPFTAAHAETAASLVGSTRRAALSLGDRACIALAMELGATAVTADRTWQRLSLPVTVRVVR